MATMTLEVNGLEVVIICGQSMVPRRPISTPASKLTMNLGTNASAPHCSIAEPRLARIHTLYRPRLPHTHCTKHSNNLTLTPISPTNNQSTKP
jgi:hypothetical protein